MKLEVFRIYIAGGNVDSILVMLDSLSPGFLLEVKLRNGAGFDELLEVQRSSHSWFRPKNFKSLDSVARFLRQEGIARFCVATDLRC